jgi:AcrR family transcriptional regulator
VTNQTRQYRSPKRAAAAQATRSKVVAAASELFSTGGYGVTTMQAIADAAGVSVETVYANGPKRALIIAAFEVAFAGNEGREQLAERPDAAAILALDDLDRLIDDGVRFVCAANQRAAGIWRALRAAADADAEVREVMDDLVERRKRDYRSNIAALAAFGTLPGDHQKLADALSLLMSNEGYEYLVEIGGWGMPEYQEWVARAIRALIL